MQLAHKMTPILK